MTQSAGDGSAATLQQITSFLSGYSIEATRPSAEEIAALRDIVPLDTPIYVTAIPGHAPFEQIESAKRVHDGGFSPVLHVAVRNFESKDILDQVLARAVADAGVREVLVIAGDRDQVAGPFASSMDVIRSGLLERHGIRSLSVAGHPEGHPRVAADVLDVAMAEKVEAAKQLGLELQFVTQFSFDAETVINWIAHVRSRGFDHPIRIGMAGPTKLTALLRFASRCGVKASTHMLTRQAGRMMQLFGTSTPDHLITALAAVKGGLGAVQAHFFPFGGLAATAKWAAAAGGGSLTLDNTGGFEVTSA